MVVLTEEFHGGLSLKRKGAHEPGLFDDDAGGDRASGLPLSCRATKMRRLACPDGPRGGDAQAVAAAWEDDVAMGDAAAAAPPSPSPSDDGRAVAVYGDGDPDGESGGGGSSSSRRIDAPRLALRDGTGADWIRAMLREADSRTVRELLAGAAKEHGSEPDLALAVVPWVAPAAEDGDDREAAMDVEGDDEPRGQESRPWTGHGQAYGAVAGEGLVYRWPQPCWAAVAQPGPVTWSW